MWFVEVPIIYAAANLKIGIFLKTKFIVTYNEFKKYNIVDILTQPLRQFYWVPTAKLRWWRFGFYVPFNIIESYQDDGRVKMKGCVQRNRFPPIHIQTLGTAWSEDIGEQTIRPLLCSELRKIVFWVAIWSGSLEMIQSKVYAIQAPALSPRHLCLDRSHKQLLVNLLCMFGQQTVKKIRYIVHYISSR